MTSKAKVRGELTHDADFGHVCTCTRRIEDDGATRPEDLLEWAVYEHTVDVVRSVEPTESGSYYYACSRCGASGWSGL